MTDTNHNFDLSEKELTGFSSFVPVKTNGRVGRFTFT